jgi:hypothetical protein
MTNTIAQITVSLMLVTNWTGTKFNDKELGYVATNHVATVVYQGETNQYTLKTVASEKATWRQPAPQFITITNMNWSWPMTVTNIIGL